MSTVKSPETPNLKSLDRLPFKTFAGYGAGDFGFNLAFSLSTAFLLYYYTDVAGISAAAVGTMFLVVGMGRDDRGRTSTATANVYCATRNR